MFRLNVKPPETSLSLLSNSHSSELLVISLYSIIRLHGCDIHPCINQQILNRIQCVQNAPIPWLNTAFCVCKFDHISPYYVSSDWLKISQCFVLHMCCLIIFCTLLLNTSRYLLQLLHLNEFYSSNIPDTRFQDYYPFLCTIPLSSVSLFFLYCKILQHVTFLHKIISLAFFILLCCN